MTIRGIVTGSALALLLTATAAAAAPTQRGERGDRRVSSSESHRSRSYRPPAGRRSVRRAPVRGGARIYVGGWNYGAWGPSWSVWWDPWWYGGYGPGYYPYPRVYPQPGARYGALDLDVRPERAEVWIDGKRVGVADEFDGFPNYLWLDEGTYDVVFYYPGRKTLARQYTIYPGLVIDVEDRLEEGESVHPLDLGPKSHVNRDERLRRDRERIERWQAAEPPPAADSGSIDARAEPGRLRVWVTPEDASVYLDGRFLGSGRELGSLRAGLIVDSGRHLIEVVRPGYRARRTEVEVGEGEEQELSVELDPDAVN